MIMQMIVVAVAEDTPTTISARAQPNFASGDMMTGSTGQNLALGLLVKQHFDMTSSGDEMRMLAIGQSGRIDGEI
jgi:hypothetical protein